MGPSKPVRRRVYLFITRRSGGKDQLLVFRHRDPRLWAGVQTPGGTVEPGEAPKQAALREAYEETGLEALGSPFLLAEDTYENDDELLRRSFFHLPLLQETADRWTHAVSAGESDAGIEFDLAWLDLPEAAGLDSHFRAYLDRLPLDEPL